MKTEEEKRSAHTRTRCVDICIEYGFYVKLMKFYIYTREKQNDTDDVYISKEENKHRKENRRKQEISLPP